jgi:hypothetical protein
MRKRCDSKNDAKAKAIQRQNVNAKQCDSDREEIEQRKRCERNAKAILRWKQSKSDVIKSKPMRNQHTNSPHLPHPSPDHTNAVLLTKRRDFRFFRFPTSRRKHTSHFYPFITTIAITIIAFNTTPPTIPFATLLFPTTADVKKIETAAEAFE